MLVGWVLSFAPLGGRTAGSRLLPNAALLLLAAVGFVAAGWVFPQVRPTLHEPRFSSLAALWAALWFGAFAVARWKGDAALGWPLLALPLFVFFPTVYRYGAAPALAPAWMGFALSTAVSKKATLDAPGANMPVANHARPSWLRSPALPVLALTLVLLFPFSGAEASDYRFETWVFFPVRIGQGQNVWLVVAWLAKLVLFVRPGLPLAAYLADASAVVLLGTAETAAISSTAELVSGALLVGGWAYARRLPEGSCSTAGRHAVRVASIAGPLLLFHATTEMDDQTYLWLDCLLAALFASSRLVASAVSPSSRRIAYALLLLFAWIGTGWISFAWTVHRMEWHFLYDWFAPGFVERRVALFVPLILARYLLPLFIARSLLIESLGPPSPEARRLVWTLAGTKVLTLLLVTIGIGWANSDSDVYLEAAQETGIGTVLAAGLL
jgi:hypothetical protein